MMSTITTSGRETTAFCNPSGPELAPSVSKPLFSRKRPTMVAMLASSSMISALGMTALSFGATGHLSVAQTKALYPCPVDQDGLSLESHVGQGSDPRAGIPEDHKGIQRRR